MGGLNNLCQPKCQLIKVLWPLRTSPYPNTLQWKLWTECECRTNIVCFAKSGWHLYWGLGHILCSVQHSTDVCCRLLCKHRLVLAPPAPRAAHPPTSGRSFPWLSPYSWSLVTQPLSWPDRYQPTPHCSYSGRTLAPTIAVMIVTRTVTMLVWRPGSSCELVTSRVTRDSVRTRVCGTSRGVTRAGRLLTPRTLETAETRETRDSGEDGTRRTWHVRQWLIDEYYRAPAPAAAPPAPHPPQLHPPPRHAALQRVLQRRPVLQGAGPSHLHHP